MNKRVGIFGQNLRQTSNAINIGLRLVASNNSANVTLARKRHVEGAQ